LACFVLLVFTGLLASGTAQALNSADRSQPTAQTNGATIQGQQQTLVVGSEQDYPPFATGSTDATAGGFTVDLWKAVAAESNLKYTLRVLPFHQLLQEFKDGKIDVLINLAPSDERHKFADFSVPHATVRGATFVRKSATNNIRTEDDLAGKSIIVLNADLGHEYALSKGWAQQLVLVDTAAQGLRLLASGQHDAMLLSKLVGVQTLQTLGLTNIEALKVKLGFQQKFSFATLHGQAELLEKVNEGLSITKANGTYNALYEKWFDAYEVKEVGWRDLLKYIVPMFTLFLLVAGYFFYRWQMERSRVQAVIAESRNLLLTIIDTAPVRVFWKDRNSRYLGSNTLFASDVGVAHPRDLIGKDDYQMPWAAQADSFRADDKAVMETGIAKLSYDELQMALTGKLIWQRKSKVPLKNQRNKTVGVLGIYEDITERKQAEEAIQQSERELKEVQVLANIRNWQWDLKTDQHFWPEQIFQIDGRDPHTPAASYLQVQSYFTVESFALLSSIVERCLIDGSPYECDAEVVRPDGVHRWVVVSGEALKDEDGKIVKLRGTVQDISDRRQMEIEIQEAKEFAENIVESVRESLLVLDAELRILTANHSFYDCFKVTSAETIGKFIYDLGNGQWDIAKLRILFEEILPNASVFNGYEVEHDFPVIGQKTFLLNAREIFREKIGSKIILLAMEDITERKLLEDQVRQLAFHDVLTKLPNRRLLTDRMSQTMAASKRSGKYAALIFLDLDNFKPLNDEHGHDAGDLLLVEVATRLKSSVRAIDTVARIGGDEFVVLLSELNVDKAGSASQADIVAEKIRVRLAEPYLLKTCKQGTTPTIVEHHCTASIGVVVFINHASNQDDLLKQADAAMYRAKEDGRNAIRFYDPGI
jgi:diguanylate cyclase (GGDEF)-like protein/PAS domain S-box-containing protein